MAITKVELLDEHGTYLQDLTGWLEGSRMWKDPRRGFGKGAIAVNYDHADESALTSRRLIRYTLDSDPDGTFTWMLQRRHEVRITTGGESRKVVHWAGDGALSYLGTEEFGHAIVVGDGDSGRKTFGWITVDWDDSTWTEPTSRGLANTLLTEAEGDDWPDDTAEWIGSDSIDVFTGSGNPSYLRRWLDVAARPQKAGNVRVYATALSPWTLWWDGEQIMSGGGFPDGSMQIGSVDLTIEAPGHQIALKTDAGPGLLTVVQLLDNGGIGGVIYRSFTQGVFGTGDPDPWVGKEEGAVPDGVTYGYVMSRLIDAAKARGTISGASYTFTDDLDTDGNAWSVSLPIYVARDGDQLGDLAVALTQDFSCDCRMLPDLEFGGYDTLGTDVSASVKLVDEADVTDPEDNAVSEAEIDEDAIRATAARVETEGGFGWAIDTTRQAEWGRLETKVSYGLASSVEEVEQAALSTLDDSANLRRQPIKSHGPTGARPYTDYSPGYRVGAREEDGGAFVSVRVEEIGVNDLPADEVDFDVMVERR